MYLEIENDVIIDVIVHRRDAKDAEV